MLFEKILLSDFDFPSLNQFIILWKVWQLFTWIFLRGNCIRWIINHLFFLCKLWNLYKLFLIVAQQSMNSFHMHYKVVFRVNEHFAFSALSPAIRHRIISCEICCAYHLHSTDVVISVTHVDKLLGLWICFEKFVLNFIHISRHNRVSLGQMLDDRRTKIK